MFSLHFVDKNPRQQSMFAAVVLHDLIMIMFYSITVIRDSNLQKLLQIMVVPICMQQRGDVCQNRKVHYKYKEKIVFE